MNKYIKIVGGILGLLCINNTYADINNLSSNGNQNIKSEPKLFEISINKDNSVVIQDNIDTVEKITIDNIVKIEDISAIYDKYIKKELSYVIAINKLDILDKNIKFYKAQIQNNGEIESDIDTELLEYYNKLSTYLNILKTKIVEDNTNHIEIFNNLYNNISLKLDTIFYKYDIYRLNKIYTLLREASDKTLNDYSSNYNIYSDNEKEKINLKLIKYDVILKILGDNIKKRINN